MILKYNVLLFVLDTLREDHSQGLSRLESEGFVRYENALSPAPWTLPTHVSIFTGLMPSKHGAHERVGAQYYELHAESMKAMSRNSTLLSSLHNEGYRTYAFSSNPLISRRFGFRFDYYHDFAQDPRESKLNSFLSENKIASDAGKLEKMILLIKKRKLGLLAFMLYNRKLKKHIDDLLRRPPSQPDKLTRSQRFLDVLESSKFVEPFFLFVNLMEAHEPYFRGIEKEDAFLHKQFAILTNSDYQSNKLDVRGRYAKHAKLSTSRLIEVMHVLEPLYERSIIIVTSDHGQLLGEGNKYGHGYFLDDELLKVPLYVRYPSSCEPLHQRPKSLINLTEIPKIVNYAYNQRHDNLDDGFSLGSDASVSESFGMMSDCSDFTENEDQLRKFRASYSWRVKIHLFKGSAIYNADSDAFEEIRGDISDKDAKDSIFKILNKDSSATVEQQSPSSSTSQGIENEEVFTESEIRDLEAKLGTLGYS